MLGRPEGAAIEGHPAGDRLQEERVRRRAVRLSARGTDLGIPYAEDAGLADRGARDHRCREPDGGRHRAQDLQRLHEGLHLSEAGARQHPAGGDAHAEGRAGASVRLRDLQPADALEPDGHRPPLPARGDRPQGAGGRPGAGRLHAGAPPAERGPHGGRHRWAEDRAAAGVAGRRAPRWQPHRLRAAARRAVDHRAARSARAGRVRRGGRIRHHGALGQEQPEADPAAAGAARAIRDVWRRAVRRHARGRRRDGAGVRSHRAVHGCGQADHARRAQRTGARRAVGVRLPDGAAAHRRRQGRLDRQSAAAAAGGRDRRGPDRDRCGHRVAGLLRGAGREIPAAFRGARRRHRRGRDPRPLGRPGPRGCRGVPGPRARAARGARAGSPARSRGADRGDAARMGRRHHRVPPPPDRQPLVHAEPRGSRKGA